MTSSSQNDCVPRLDEVLLFAQNYLVNSHWLERQEEILLLYVGFLRAVTLMGTLLATLAH